AKGGAVIFKSEKVRDYQLSSHLKDYCSSKKVGIEDKAVSLLCEYIGGPLSKLFGEVNKLIHIKGENGKITVEDIEQHIGISKDFNNFELTSAVATKNYPKAIQIIKYFQSNPKTNPTVMTTSTLFNFFSKLVIAHYLPDKSDDSLKVALGVRFPSQLNEIKTALRNYNPYGAVNAIHALREFDVKSKGVDSYQNEYSLLTELIFKIFTL
ncbi:MAG: DNA polymerase III subunit delta, partial [Muribaculaceae bacterium]|nr:DNA polymerase III subunit delta [Muribaculaceae bacterium]